MIKCGGSPCSLSNLVFQEDHPRRVSAKVRVGKLQLRQFSQLTTQSINQNYNYNKIMVVHSLTIFDRKGKTIFTKTFSQAALKQQQILQQSAGPTSDPGVTDAVTEQRKLVFGMLFSLREIIGSLSPEDTVPCKFF